MGTTILLEEFADRLAEPRQVRLSTSSSRSLMRGTAIHASGSDEGVEEGVVVQVDGVDGGVVLQVGVEEGGGEVRSAGS